MCRGIDRWQNAVRLPASPTDKAKVANGEDVGNMEGDMRFYKNCIRAWVMSSESSLDHTRLWRREDGGGREEKAKKRRRRDETDRLPDSQ